MTNRNLEQVSGGAKEQKKDELLFKKKAVELYRNVVENFKDSRLLRNQRGSISGTILGAGGIFTLAAAGVMALSGGGEKASNDNTDVVNQPKTSVIEKVVKHKKAEREIFDGSGDCVEEVLGPVADTVIGDKISEKENVFLMDLDYELETCIEKNKISKGETIVTDPDVTERERDIYDAIDGKEWVRTYFP